MSVSATTNSASSISQLNSTSRTQRQRPDNDGDGDGGVRGHRRGEGGGFRNAIASALSQLGIGTTSGTTASSSSNSASQDSASTSSASQSDQAQALSAFMHSLMAALHAQSNPASATAPQAGTDSDGDNDGSTAATQGHRHRPNVQGDLQSLMQELASGSSSTSGADPTVGALQQSFQSLLSAYGDSGSSATLGNFLQALSSQFPGGSTSGNVVKTTA